jgi:hypothetical protein
LAHLAFAATEIFCLAVALILRLAFSAGFAETCVPFTFAHLAFAATEILALAAALIFRLFFGAAVTASCVGKPNNWLNSFPAIGLPLSIRLPGAVVAVIDL